MFCYQCEQTAKGEGCTKIGVCGKQPEVSDLQDLLAYALKELAFFAVEGRKVGINDKKVNVFTVEALSPLSPMWISIPKGSSNWSISA